MQISWPANALGDMFAFYYASSIRQYQDVHSPMTLGTVEVGSLIANIKVGYKLTMLCDI